MRAPNLATLERNLELLIGKCYSPAVPDAQFREQLRARVQAELATSQATPAVAPHSTPLHRMPRFLIPLAAAAAVLAIFLNEPVTPAPPTLDQILGSGELAWRPAAEPEWSVWTSPRLDLALTASAEFASPGEAFADQGASISMAGSPTLEFELGVDSRLLAGPLDGSHAPVLALQTGSLDIELKRADKAAALTIADRNAPCMIDLAGSRVRLSHGKLHAEFESGPNAIGLLLSSGSAHVRSGEDWIALRVGVPERLIDGVLQREEVAISMPTSTSSREELATDPESTAEEVSNGPQPSVRLTVVSASDKERVREFRLIAIQVENQYNIRAHVVGDLSLDGEEIAQIENLSAGKYTLDVIAPGYAAWRSHDFWIEAGETKELVAELEEGAIVRGRVFDPMGKPLAGALVVNEAEALPMIISMDELPLQAQVQRLARTNAAGEFELPLQRSGQTVFRASHPDYAPGWSAFIDLKTGETASEVLIHTTRGGAIRGRVETEQGLPAVGTEILASLSEMSGKQLLTSYRTQRTRETGEYLIDRLPAGFYALLRFQSTTRSSSGSSPDLNIIEVKEGEVVEFNFIPELVGTRLFGRLTTANGAPLARMGLSLARQEGAHWNESKQDYAMTDDNGNYQFTGVEAGRHVIYITRDFGSTVINIGEFDIPRASNFEHNVELSDKNISGMIRDRETGEPVRNCFVALFQIETPDDPGIFIGRQVTREDGRFLFHNVPEYYYRVIAQSTVENYGHETVVGILPPSSGEPIEFTLTVGGTIELHAVDSAGNPIAGAAIRFLDQDGLAVEFSMSDRTNSDGRFTTRGVRPGTWNVIVSAKGFEPVTKVCRVVTDLTEELVFRLVATTDDK